MVVEEGKATLVSIGCQSVVYLSYQYAGCPCLFTLEETEKLEKSQIQASESVKLASVL